MGKVYSMTIKYLDSKRISGLSLTYAYNVTTGGGQFNGMASNAPSGGVRARQGVKILSNFSDIGKKVQDITIGIRKNGTVSGTVNVQYINSSYTVLATASMNASELGTGTDDTYDFTLSSEVTIADGDRLLLQYSATVWSNGVVLNGASGTRPTGTDYTYEGTLNSNSFTDGSGSGVPMMTFGGADIKPTNVQDNSIFVETDTARRYWFDDATTLTFEDDLSSSTNWAGLSGAFSYDATNDEIDFNADTSGSSAYWNLGSTLSDTAWVMRMKVRLDTFSATSANMQNFTIGLSSTNGAYNTTQDSIGMLIRADGAGSKYKSTWGNDTSQNGNTSNFTRTPSAETIYLEIIRTSATGFTVNQYSDTAYSTLLESKVVTGVTATALQYVKLTTYSEATTNNMVGAITDVKVYDEATSVTPATWTRQPPSFTASFWGAGGTAGPWTPVNYHDEFNGSTWSSATALGTSVEMVSGCGTKTAGLVIGGDIGGTNQPISTVQEWNGSAWSTSTGGTLNIVRNQHASGGINTSAWAQGGTTGSMGQVTSSSFWNDTSWTSGGVTSVGRRNHGGAGSTDDCWITGGYDGSNSLASTEQYNGTSWSAGGNLSVAVNSIMGGGGDTYNAIITGGYDGSNNSNRSNIYNGTAWSLGGTLSNAHRYGITSGTPDDAIAGLGYVSSWTPTWAELYNGTTWSTTGSVSSGRTTGAGGN